MSDADIEKRIREAYRTLQVPDGLKAATLARIEALRAEEEALKSEEPAGCAHGAPEAACGAGIDQSARAANAPCVKRTRRARPRWTGRAVAAVAACMVVAAVGVGGYAYATVPVARVGIDVNPSFELALSRFGRVVEAKAVDGDAAEVLARVDIEGMEYEDAMDVLAQECEGYFGEGAVVEVGVACDDETRCAAIESTTLRCFEDDSVQVHCGRVSDEQWQAAREAGMGAGRYRVYEALVDQGVDIAQEDAAVMPMRELRAIAADAGVDTRDSACAAHGGACAAGRGQGRGANGVQDEGSDQAGGQGAPAGQGRQAGAGYGRENGGAAGSAGGQDADGGQGNGAGAGQQGQGLGNGGGQGHGPGAGQGGANGQGRGGAQSGA